MSLWKGPFDSFASSSPPQFLSCHFLWRPFLTLVSDGPHCFLQWSGVALSFHVFHCCFGEMVPTAPLPLLCSFLLPLSLQNFTQGEKKWINYLFLLVYLSSLSTCIISDHINLTISLLNFLLSSWLLIIQAIYESMQAFCSFCTEVYQIFSITSV